MSVLPSQKLSIGELYVAMAVGLILNLLPNDFRNNNNIETISLSETCVFLAAFIITIVFLLIIKRYEAVGAALLTNSVITLGTFLFGTVHGLITSGLNYWPSISEYQLVTMFILWTVPLFITMLMRLFSHEPRDSDESRAGFCRFLVLSLRGLVIIYLLVLVFVQILPSSPNTLPGSRTIYFIPTQRIGQCIENINTWGLLYLLWNGLLLAPLSFSITILRPRTRWWTILFVSFVLGLTVEILQFSFNTGTVYVDDIILYLIGGMLGFFLKHIVDSIRSVITLGTEKTMLSFRFTPVVTAPQGIIESYEEDEEQPEKDEDDEEDFDSDFSDTSEFPALVEPPKAP